MPDVSTHLMFGIALGIFVYLRRSREEAMLVVLGSVLIDIERPFTWILQRSPYSWIGLTSAFHSILGAVVLSYFASCCILSDQHDFWLRFKLLLLGCIEHLLLDMTMHPWEEFGVLLLYPLRIPFAFRIFWSDYLWFPIYGIIALSISILVWYVVSKPFQRDNKIPT